MVGLVDPSSLSLRPLSPYHRGSPRSPGSICPTEPTESELQNAVSLPPLSLPRQPPPFARARPLFPSPPRPSAARLAPSGLPRTDVVLHCQRRRHRFLLRLSNKLRRELLLLLLARSLHALHSIVDSIFIARNPEVELHFRGNAGARVNTYPFRGCEIDNPRARQSNLKGIAATRSHRATEGDDDARRARREEGRGEGIRRARSENANRLRWICSRVLDYVIQFSSFGGKRSRI